MLRRLESGLGHAVLEFLDAAEVLRDGDTRLSAGTESVTAAPVVLPQVLGNSVQSAVIVNGAPFPASFSVENVVTEVGHSHGFEVIVVNVKLVIEFMGLHVLEHFGGDSAEVLGKGPLLDVLHVHAFIGHVGGAAEKAVHVGLAGGWSAESARTHVACVQSRAFVVIHA